MEDNQRRLNEVDRLIKEGRRILFDLEKSYRIISLRNNFTLSGLLGRNMVGDLVRDFKVSSINYNIDRMQEDLLKFHKDLMLFDEGIAKRVDLPYKLSQYKGTRSALADIMLRSKMRKKELEMQEVYRRMRSVVKRLLKERDKILLEIRKEREFSEFVRNEVQEEG